MLMIISFRWQEVVPTIGCVELLSKLVHKPMKQELGIVKSNAVKVTYVMLPPIHPRFLCFL